MNQSYAVFISIFLIGCNIGGNSPPRFKTFNGEEVKYLFGIAYLQSSVFEGVLVDPGTKWNITVEVSDANGDDIEILFPSAPGVLEFDQETHTGYWDIPDEVPNYYPALQVLAVDEQGASDVLFVNLEVKQDWDSGAWDSGLWDTGWWEEPYYSGGPYLTGDINVENGFVGSVEYRNPALQCRITWQYVEGHSIENCEWCERTWKINLQHGTVETRPDSCRNALSSLESQEWNIGWTSSVLWNNLQYENPVFLDHPTAGWTPMGQGQLEGNRFGFTLQTP